MAFTVTTDLTTVDDAEATTDWTTGSLDPDRYVQGSNSIGWYIAKNSRGSNGVGSKSISHAAGDHLYFWMSSDVISKAEAKTTGTTTASGLTVLVTLSGGATREWHVAGSDTWDGGWKCFVIDLGHTGTQLYAQSGTWSTANNITDIDFYMDLSNSGNIRNVPANQYNDVIRVGTGITAYNTSAADPAFDFADIAATADSTTNKYGILAAQTSGGSALGCQGKITIGDTGTNHLDFDSQGETVEFLVRNGTGDGIVADTLYGIEVVGNATGSDQDFSMGIKVGTGDTARGRNGTIIRAGGTAAKWDFTCNDADLHNVTLYGSTLQGATVTTTADGVIFADPTTTGEIAGCTFDGCSQVDTDGLTVRNTFFINSVAATTEAALGPWVGGTTDVAYSFFINNPNAIVFEATPTGDEDDFSGMIFVSNTYAVRNESNGNNFDINLVNGSTTLITDTDNNDVGTAQLTFVSSYAYTLTNIANPSEVTILDYDVSQLDITGTATAVNVGDAAATERQGQSFQVTTAGKAERIRLNLRKVGTPTDGLTIRLVNGVPGSTLLAESVAIDGTDLTTSFVEYDVDLTEKNQLALATTYGIEIQRTGSTDGSNYYQVEYSTTSVHASGTRYVYNTSWGTAGGDLLFSVMEAASENELYHAETVTTGTTTYNHPGTAKTVEVLAMSLNEKQLVFLDSLSATAKSVPVVQIADPFYSNP